jgi:pantoate--beta-alanine ligase
MQIISNADKLNEIVKKYRSERLKIGFIPTMGALHEGHLELIRQSQLADNQIHICSIFVNPKQFGEVKDLEKYPRPIESDVEKLKSVGCSILFLPSFEQIYPKNWQPFPFFFNGLDNIMEGAHRAGHFEGVAQVVYNLLKICEPMQLFMGQKDFQQVAIVKNVLLQTGLSQQIKLISVPIVREIDGLAMSSRNIRLSETGRKQAVFISKTLFWLSENYQNFNPQEAKKQAIFKLKSHNLCEIDYLEIVDAHNLTPIASWENTKMAVACVVVRIDGVRLLDNIILY